MSRKINRVRQLAREAVDRGTPLSVSEIRDLRAESRRAVTIFKSLFWTGIVIFNLLLWAPLPAAISRPLLYVIAFSVLAVTLLVSILGLRKHQMNLELLKLNRDGLKKRTASEAGRKYIDLVKKEDRPLINAEFELLAGSKWSGHHEA